MVRSEGNMSLKNPVTPPGIDPGTVGLVAQRLNNYATPRPGYEGTNVKHLLNYANPMHNIYSLHIFTVFLIQSSGRTLIFLFKEHRTQ
jgi:hypothetical protein